MKKLKKLALVSVSALGGFLLAVVLLGFTQAGAGAGSVASRNGDANGDGRLNIADPVYLLNWLFSRGPEPVPCPAVYSWGLPATGQTKCHDASGREVDCDTAACAGQDGAYREGCPPEGRFLDNGDGTITDTCTGLTWQKETADVTGRGPADRVSWCRALTYCDELIFAQYDDWRLPNVRELLSLVNYGIEDGAKIDRAFGETGNEYWSSTSGRLAESAFYVSFYEGGTSADVKTGSYSVRAVRGP